MLLMIPGPIELSPAVHAACAMAPLSHVDPALIEHGRQALVGMRAAWQAAENSLPVVISGGGTAAMDMAVHNLVDAEDDVLVVSTGYFGDRMAEMMRRRGARVKVLDYAPGDAPEVGAVEAELDRGPYKVLAATHVDTSTGVRIDPGPMARAARQRDMLSIFDGVCATGAETFAMEAWGADVYLTASQKAIGLPPGLGLVVFSQRALRRRTSLRHAPPMALDLTHWEPIMRAYLEGRGSYFSTPATSLWRGLATALDELLTEGMQQVFSRHARVATAMRRAWATLGLELLPDQQHAAHTLSTLRFPPGVGPELVAAVAAQGVAIAGGLHPLVRHQTFRVGHMGFSARTPSHLLQTVDAVGRALGGCGHSCDVSNALHGLAADLAFLPTSS